MSEQIQEQPKEPVSARDAVAAAYEQLEKGAPEVEAKAEPETEYTPEDPVETEAQKAERLRNEKGQFAKPEDKPKVEAAKEAKAQVDIPPPTNWKGDAKINWKRLPPAIRQEISNDYAERQQLEQRASQYDQILTPQRRQALTVAYGNEVQGLNQILATVEYSNQDPEGFLKWFAQNRRIDLTKFAAPQQQEQQYVDPALQQVTQELNGLKQTIAQQQQWYQQQQVSQLTQRVNAEWQEVMANGEKYPYANDLWPTMLQLVERRMANGLADAYDKASRLDPNVWARIQEGERQSQLQKQAQKAVEKRSAAVSVAGAPGGIGNAQSAAPMVNGRPETVHETLRRTMKDMEGLRL